MGHDTLGNYFQTNFSLMQHHHWSLSEIENMLPWERYVYIELLQAFLREQEEKMRQRENEHRAAISTQQRRRM